MKSIIIYFSLTGNTEKVARAIHKGMSQLVQHCDIAKIKEVDSKNLDDYDLIGIGTPIWGKAPRNVRRFIESLPYSEGKHAFSFYTFASEQEAFVPDMLSLLRSRGLLILGIRGWYGAAMSVTEPKPYPSDGHPDEIDLKEAEDFGKEMVELSQRVSGEGPEVIPPMPTMPIPLRQFLGIPSLHHKPPKLNIEKCNYPKCHLCMDNCPQDAIDLSVSPPVFGQDCDSCYFCEMICPTGAVEVNYDDEVINDKYWPVKMDVERLLLDKAEAEGLFRRLVPRKDVDWDTPIYKHWPDNKHPRYKIPPEE
jgi:flavodoxin/NAD-dependent dihydropyrimidine dehydrogenase PreA subunit